MDASRILKVLVFSYQKVHPLLATGFGRESQLDSLVGSQIEGDGICVRCRGADSRRAVAINLNAADAPGIAKDRQAMLPAIILRQEQRRRVSHIRAHRQFKHPPQSDPIPRARHLSDDGRAHVVSFPYIAIPQDLHGAILPRGRMDFHVYNFVALNSVSFTLRVGGEKRYSHVCFDCEFRRKIHLDFIAVETRLDSHILDPLGWLSAPKPWRRRAIPIPHPDGRNAVDPQGILHGLDGLVG